MCPWDRKRTASAPFRKRTVSSCRHLWCEDRFRWNHTRHESNRVEWKRQSFVWSIAQGALKAILFCYEIACCSRVSSFTMPMTQPWLCLMAFADGEETTSKVKVSSIPNSIQELGSNRPTFQPTKFQFTLDFMSRQILYAICIHFADCLSKSIIAWFCLLSNWPTATNRTTILPYGTVRCRNRFYQSVLIDG